MPCKALPVFTRDQRAGLMEHLSRSEPKERADGLLIPVVAVSGQPREAVAPGLQTTAAAFVNDGRSDPIRFGTPMQKGADKLGHNPEPLFVGAYSACYRSALGNAAKELGTPVEDSTVRALVSLIEEDQRGYCLVAAGRLPDPGALRGVDGPGHRIQSRSGHTARCLERARPDPPAAKAVGQVRVHGKVGAIVTARAALCLH